MDNMNLILLIIVNFIRLSLECGAMENKLGHQSTIQDHIELPCFQIDSSQIIGYMDDLLRKCLFSQISSSTFPHCLSNCNQDLNCKAAEYDRIEGCWLCLEISYSMDTVTQSEHAFISKNGLEIYIGMCL